MREKNREKKQHFKARIHSKQLVKLPSVFGIWVPDELELQLETKEDISRELSVYVFFFFWMNESILPIKYTRAVWKLWQQLRLDVNM